MYGCFIFLVTMKYFFLIIEHWNSNKKMQFYNIQKHTQLLLYSNNLGKRVNKVWNRIKYKTNKNMLGGKWNKQELCSFLPEAKTTSLMVSLCCIQVRSVFFVLAPVREVEQYKPLLSAVLYFLGGEMTEWFKAPPPSANICPHIT